jgi:hypothetical protein
MFQEVYYPGSVMILFTFIILVIAFNLLSKIIDRKILVRINYFSRKTFDFFFPKSEIMQSWLLVIAGIVFINSFVFANPFMLNGDKKSTDILDSLGSFLSGYVGSLFGLVSVVLLYLTLAAQRKANNDQNDAKEKENFLTRYYMMLDLHRKNVEEIRVRNYSGRVVFVRLVEELRYILQIINQLKEAEGQCYSETTRMKIAYVTLLYGVDEHCTRMLKEALNIYCKNDYIEKLIQRLSEAREKDVSLNGDVSSLGKTFFDELEYLPFDGHQSRLSHYFRHIYQMIKYIDKSKLLADKDKQEYVKTIRAQLSIYEQAIFCLNILTNTDKKWDDIDDANKVEQELQNKYNIIKDLPTTFFNPQTELDIKTEFPKNSL